MINYDFEEYCCGCSSCHDACPVGAISMKPDKNGFYMPQVDKEKCIDCGLCERICPHINASKERIAVQEPASWLYSSPDKKAIKNSASGGAFYDLAKYAINSGCVVAGCIWNKELEAEHVIVDNLAGLKAMQGSKYVQSNTLGLNKEVLEELKQGKQVVFSGTPCQCVAAHLYVQAYANGKYRDKLTTIAVICHGISTPKAWKTFKDWEKQRHGCALVGVNFRSKDREGYKKSYCRYDYEDGSTTYLPTFLPSSKYIEATLVYNLALRKSCSHCDCKGITSGCDLIIGDWYERNTGKGELGSSCIVACTEKGKIFLQSIEENLDIFTYSKIQKKNSFIEKSVTVAPNREEFLDKLDVSIWGDVEKYYPPKYVIKKFLCKLGLFDVYKRILG